jgi:hypothetical protein
VSGFLDKDVETAHKAAGESGADLGVLEDAISILLRG